MFTLCRHCADTFSKDPCTCSTSARALSGIWTTMELKVALQEGYKILHISEVYNYPKTQEYGPVLRQHGIFSEFINFFLKIKQESSGYPAWTEEAEDTEAARQHYIEQYRVNEGIILDPHSICKNPSLYLLSKLLLNSFCEYALYSPVIASD